MSAASAHVNEGEQLRGTFLFRFRHWWLRYPISGRMVTSSAAHPARPTNA